MNSDIRELIERWPLVKEFNLPEHSNVIVVGAYKGLAMAAIDELYQPDQVIGYDPQIWAANESLETLDHRGNCVVIPFALWAGPAPTGRIPMGEWHTDACSFVNVGPGSREQGFGSAMDANLALDILDFKNKIDLMVMNIESYEYHLIPYLREKGWLKKIDRLAVQWHLNFGGFTEDNMNSEIDKLVSEDLYNLEIDERPAWAYFRR